MRLLFVSQDFPPDLGGIQTYAWELARRMAKQIEHLSILAPKAAGDLEHDLQSPFAVHRVAKSSNALALATPFVIPRICRRENIDVVFHCQWQTAIGSWRMKRRGELAHYFVAAHGRELLLKPLGDGRLQGGYDGLRKSILASATSILPVSRYTGSVVRDIVGKDVSMKVVSNGVDPAHFKVAHDGADERSLRTSLGLDGRKILLTVGRLVHRKGVDTVLDAVAALKYKIPNLTYLVVGEGEEKAALQAKAEKLGIQECVRFTGRVGRDDLPRYLNLCDVFVTPSRHCPPQVEGFGLVFLEANACGKPVIGSHAGGIPDAVVDGETGLLVESENVVQLTEAIERLLNDEAFARSLGERGRLRVEQEMNWDRAADSILKTIRSEVGE